MTFQEWFDYATRNWMCAETDIQEIQNIAQAAYEAGQQETEQLLKKYINHVGNLEGITFIPHTTDDTIRLSTNPFTETELTTLHKLEQE